MVILEIFKSQEDKIMNSASSPIKGKRDAVGWTGFLEQQIFHFCFRERETSL